MFFWFEVFCMQSPYMKYLLLFIFFLLPLKTNGQKAAYDSLKMVLEKDLNFLHSYNFNDSTYENIDIEFEASRTAKNLVTLLSYNESKELKNNPLNNFRLTASYNDSLIRIFKSTTDQEGHGVPLVTRLFNGTKKTGLLMQVPYLMLFHHHSPVLKN